MIHNVCIKHSYVAVAIANFFEQNQQLSMRLKSAVSHFNAHLTKFCRGYASLVIYHIERPTYIVITISLLRIKERENSAQNVLEPTMSQGGNIKDRFEQKELEK